MRFYHVSKSLSGESNMQAQNRKQYKPMASGADYLLPLCTLIGYMPTTVGTMNIVDNL